ncbi:MAG: hypothetical protein AMS26_18515, partial [Bacteroides sp. SM23_62]
LDVYFLSPSALDFRQSDKFPVAPEERYEGAPDQWHFKGSTVADSDEMRFLVLMVPLHPEKDADALPEVKRLDYGNVKGFQVGEEKVLAWWGTGEIGDFSAAGSEKNAKMIIEYSEKGEIRKRIVH